MKKRSQKEFRKYVRVHTAFQWQRQALASASLAYEPRYLKKEQGKRFFFPFLPIIFSYVLKKDVISNWNSNINFRVWSLVLRVLCICSHWVHVYGLAIALPELLQVVKWPIDSVIAKGFLLKYLKLFLAAYLPPERTIRQNEMECMLHCYASCLS